MFKLLFSTAVLTVLSLAPVQASNSMILLKSGDLGQKAKLDTVGNGNVLEIIQSGPMASGNSITVSVNGDLNGAGAGKAFTGRPALLGLTAGALIQDGNGNAMSIEVVGDRNLFAVSQLGNNNSAHGRIEGSDNQAAIFQTGVGNFVAFSQSGMGNNISVQQTSW